jgi:biopolymer transport protein ExbB/biopolymer transport protein TolQ
MNFLFLVAQTPAPEMSFGLREIIESMTILTGAVAVILVLMSIWSVYVTIERLLTYARARKQSLEFAKKLTPLLAKDQPAEAIELSRKYKGSHLARVTRAGLIEFLYDQTTTPASVQGHDVIEAAKRAIEREALVVYSDLKKGVGGLATIATTAPFIGLFGTVIGIINAFRGMALSGSGGIGSVSKGISEALVATALGLGVAIPAAWLFNYFTNVLERFQVEMTNSASELVDFFIKKQGTKQGAPHAGVRV